MTILGDDVWGDDWTIGFEDNSPSNIVVATQSGRAFSIPYQIGKQS